MRTRRLPLALVGIVLLASAGCSTLYPTRPGLGFARAGDKEAGLGFTGDSFEESYLRYYPSDRLGIQGGLLYDRFGRDGESDTQLGIRLGAPYTICDYPRHRGYLLPSVGYERIQQATLPTRSGFSAGLALGGDVKLNDYLALGLEGGVRFARFADDLDGDDDPSFTRWTIGNTNRMNVTFRFPRRDYTE